MTLLNSVTATWVLHRLGLSEADHDEWDATWRALEAWWAEGRSVREFLREYRAQHAVTSSQAPHRLTRMGPS